MSDIITIDEFTRIEIRVGKVEKAENVEESRKLILLTVNFGTSPDGPGTRTIYTAVREYGYRPDSFQGKQFLFITNLAPRKMPGGESQGMILATSNAADAVDSDKPLFISAEGLPIGSRVN